nr:hypothetical protein [Candidatus Sigynarchaeota archaeon]
MRETTAWESMYVETNFLVFIQGDFLVFIQGDFPVFQEREVLLWNISICSSYIDYR